MQPIPKIVPYIQQWWKNLGFGQILILIMQVGLLFINGCGYEIENKLIQHNLLVYQGDYWRLLTSLLYSIDYVQILQNWLIFQLITNNYETIVGSAYFILDIFFKNFILELVYFLVNYGLSCYDVQQIYTYSYGLGGLTMYYLCSKLIGSPYKKMSFYFFQIQNIYLILVIPLSVFYYTEDWIYIFGFQLAIFEWFYFDGMILRLSNNYIEKISYVFGEFRQKDCFKRAIQSMKEAKQYVQSEQDFTQLSEQDFGGRGILIGMSEDEEKQSRLYDQNRYQQI
ncbi:unnamed protein product [Paramecium sonneborni]|uniref:Uncharacterized protein n=1 Tax=Paramecium sonneborni TaxID=65129 RepID=A0A8S1RAP9_9CILI|nr:unnamed protein product [Paramecium sonneborni]